MDGASLASPATDSQALWVWNNKLGTIAQEHMARPSCTWRQMPLVNHAPDLRDGHRVTKDSPGHVEAAARAVLMPHDMHVTEQAARPLNARCTSPDMVLATNLTSQQLTGDDLVRQGLWPV